MSKQFVHLRLHSAYSLSEGAIKIDKLVQLCEENRMPAVAVTDTNNLFGAIEFSTKCADRGVQPIIACQLNIQHTKKINRPTSVLLYVKNKNGYQNLIQLVSNAYLSSSSPTYPEISLDLLSRYSEDLILATGGIYGSLGALLLEDNVAGAKEYLNFLGGYFNNRLYVELSRHGNERENKIEERAISLAYGLNLPILATNNVCYPQQQDFNPHDVLICIAQGRTIYDSERETSSPEFYFKTPEEMTTLFADLPEAIENTVNIARRCHFMLEKRKPMLPVFKPKSEKNQDEELRDIAVKGLEARLKKFKDQENYSEIRTEYFKRLEYELSMIQKMGFSGYFLIVADYVGWAKLQNIPVGPGRGSGAGSIVAWSVEITDIDPIRFKLFFERFLNPDRLSMPDFDIDFCQERRDEVIDYVQKKYGYQSVAQIITFGKLQAKAVVRDVGRVLAMAYGFIDKISKMIPFNPASPLTLREAIDSEQLLRDLMDSDPQVKNLMEIALKLEGLYRHPSVHAAGVVISDRNLQEMIPLYKDSKSTMPITQFSMKYIESAGLIKFDFLGLKTLTVIQKVLDLLKKVGINLTTQEIPLDDKKTFELLKKVNCVGVFQIESGGMRDVLKKMQPDRVEDLIALVALYRPGPMDDIPKYIACKHGMEPITYLHEKLKPILEETYGVMVYQEQVMQIAQSIGGYTLGQADILRRAMGKKNKDEMLSQKKRFVDGAVERGIALNIAKRLFEQMNKFAGYGFNKSHSTPYGLLTYQTAFLKANYTKEFFAAIMTLDMNNTDKLCASCQDAQKNKIKIIPPDINVSKSEFIIDYSNNAIIYSLAAIKGSGDHVVQEIVKERETNGPYQSIFDFIERLEPRKILNRRFIENFIKSGVFDKLHQNRKQLLESLDIILSVKLSSEQEVLFEKYYPKLVEAEEWGQTEKLQNEFSAIGFYISSHPIQQYENVLKQSSFTPLAEAKELFKSRIVVIINDFSFKTTKTQNKFCILQISDTSMISEATMFSETFTAYRDLIEVGNIVILDVVCQKNEERVRIVIDKVQKFDASKAVKISMKPILPKTPSGALSAPSVSKIFQIKIDGKKELTAIKSLIDNFRKNGSHSIELILPENKKILLPDKYFLTSYDILGLRNAIGINNVIEIIKNYDDRKTLQLDDKTS
ncbi:MAG: DNA polymerase III subunit alpha [Holosporaceae bacterium]|jgi:DNA polymerase-3 subunit alpha|nr:DNA polymerase III subunit alpha [Holosporaceae bacterium]